MSRKLPWNPNATLADDGKRLVFHLTKEEARQELWLLNRALNTLEPADWPPVAAPYLKALEDFLK